MLFIVVVFPFYTGKNGLSGLEWVFAFPQDSLLLLFSHSVVSDSFCDPTDCNLPDSSVHGISQVRTLGLVIISFSKVSCPSRD